MNEKMQLNAILKGRVQGVGCRATVLYHAKRLGIMGTVRNLRDGTVEIVAQGPKDKLEQLLDEVQREFGKDYIFSCTKEFYPINQTYDSFIIL